MPTTYPEFAASRRDDHGGRKVHRHLRNRAAGQVRPLFAGVRCIPAVWGHGGSIFGKDKKFSGNDEKAIAGLKWYQELLKNAPPNSTASTWDGQFEMMHSGQVALVQSWDEFFPGLDADDFKVQGPLGAVQAADADLVALAGRLRLQ